MYLEQPKSRRTRSVHAPERYRERSPESEESDTVCLLCNSREPPIACSTVFWVDCDHCSEWAHTHTVHWEVAQLHASLCV